MLLADPVLSPAATVAHYCAWTHLQAPQLVHFRETQCSRGTAAESGSRVAVGCRAVRADSAICDTRGVRARFCVQQLCGVQRSGPASGFPEVLHA